MPISSPYKRRFMRACLQPLVVNASDRDGVSALRLDPELLWAACLSEFEEVEIRTQDGRAWQAPVMAGGAGEVEVMGALSRQIIMGDVVTVTAYAYVSGAAEEEHRACFVHVGEGNRAIEIASRRAASFPVHPSYALPVDGDVRGATP